MTSVRRGLGPVLIVLLLGAACGRGGYEVVLRHAALTDLPVFPGAQGYGTETPAGRGGTLLRVTTLAADGPGSLAEALAATEPRTVVFDVGGVIDLTPLGGTLWLREPFVTIAGQTAPAPGIILVGGGLLLYEVHDVLVQHIAVRPGSAVTDGHAIKLGVGCHHVVLDHVSATWSTSENVLFWDTSEGISDVTVNASLIAEGLGSGWSSKGLTIIHNSLRVAVLGNLFVHNGTNNPWLNAGFQGVVLNNLVVNPYRSSFMIVAVGEYDPAPQPVTASFVGNAFARGPSTEQVANGIGLSGALPAGTRVYAADNAFVDDGSEPVIEATEPQHLVPVSPIDLAAFTSRSPAESATRVPETAGSRPAARDYVDARIVAEAVARSGRLIASEAEVGGWAGYTASERPFIAPEEPEGDDDGDGYTNLEERLETLAATLEGR